ncbi:MAG: exo-alpha-sialidase, partial [Phycisphaerae bacterium]
MNNAQHHQWGRARPRLWRLMLGACVCACTGASAWGEEPAAAASASASSAASASASAPTPRLIGTATVFRYEKADPYDRSNLYGFNHAPSVTLLADGRLLAAWFSGPYEASVHQVILGSFSSDGGATWSPAQVLQDDPHRSDFDPAFLSDGTRTWLCFSVGRWNRYPPMRAQAGEDAPVGPESFRIWGCWSDDAGRTWSEPVRLLDDVGWGCRSNGIQLSSGELILPVHHFMTWTAAVIRSTDGGRSWQRSSTVKPADGGGAAEPSVAELPDGRLLMIVRSRDGVLRTATSLDRGVTWSKPVKTGVVAGDASSNLLSLRDGRLVLTYNAGPPPHRTPLAVCVSDDEGRTWGPLLELDRADPPTQGEAFWSREVCYPSAVELPDGTVVIVWA